MYHMMTIGWEHSLARPSDKTIAQLNSPMRCASSDSEHTVRDRVAEMVWLIVALASWIAGYLAYRLVWGALALLRPHPGGEESCSSCGIQTKTLHQCDSCGLYVCLQHAVAHSRGVEQELVQATGQSEAHYSRLHPIPPGYWCLACDGKRLVAIVIGIVLGDLTFVAVMRWLLSDHFLLW
jgi:hypothetical protein